MNKILWCLLMMISWTSRAQPETTNSIDVLKQYIEKETVNQMKEKQVPGLAIAILDEGKVLYKNTLGYADRKSGKPITFRTGFNLGSISKMFTAWGILKLVEQGKIDLNAPVEQYLTRWQLPTSEFDHSKVTIKALLSHTAGISVHGYPGFHPDAELPDIEASLNGENGPVRANEPVEVIIEPQTTFQYSGGGYTILQLAIEEITGHAFEQYMADEIFKPLKMKETSFNLTKGLLKNSATPYNKEGEEVYYERFTVKAAAGLQSTLEDLILFVRASFEGNEVLSQETLLNMIQPLPLTKSKRGGYGLGYSTYYFGPFAVQGHAGSNTGWESGVMMTFEDKSGVIILTNSSNGKSIAINILQQWLRWKNQ